MKAAKRILLYMVLVWWGVYCVIGISKNIYKYDLLNLVIALAIATAPYVVFFIVKIRRQNKTKEKPVAEVTEIPQAIINSEPLHYPSGQYIEKENVLYRVDGKPITDDEIPYLIATGYQREMERQGRSTNPKFHRTLEEEDLADEFSDKHSAILSKLEGNLYKKVDDIPDLGVRKLKKLTTEELEAIIQQYRDAISEYETLRNFCYRKEKGGAIYFEDRWEHLHNSKNPDFSYLSIIIDKKRFVEEVLLDKITKN